jgi:hypothetical protein
LAECSEFAANMHAKLAAPSHYYVLSKEESRSEERLLRKTKNKRAA